MDESSIKGNKRVAQSSGVSVLDATLLNDSFEIGEIISSTSNLFVEVKGSGILKGRYADTKSGKYFLAISPEGKNLKFLVKKSEKIMKEEGMIKECEDTRNKETINIPMMEPIFKTFDPLENFSSKQLSVLQGISNSLKGDLQGAIGDVRPAKRTSKSKGKVEKRPHQFVPRFIETPQRRIPDLNPIMEVSPSMREQLIHQQPSTTMSEIDQFLKSQNCLISQADRSNASGKTECQNKNEKCIQNNPISNAQNLAQSMIPSQLSSFNHNFMRYAHNSAINASMCNMMQMRHNMSQEQMINNQSMNSNAQMMNYFNRIPLNIPVGKYLVRDKTQIRHDLPGNVGGNHAFVNHPSLWIPNPNFAASHNQQNIHQISNDYQTQHISAKSHQFFSNESRNVQSLVAKKSREPNYNEENKQVDDSNRDIITPRLRKTQKRLLRSRSKISYEGFGEFLTKKKLTIQIVKKDVNLRKTMKREWQSLSDEQRRRYKEQQNNKTETVQQFKCAMNGCSNLAVSKPDRGGFYCCDGCLVKHCKLTFKNWVSSSGKI